MQKEEVRFVFVFIPALVAILKNAEDKKGTPLTETEVINIRNVSTCMKIPEVDLPALEESRGYKDINPENCWNEWCEIRKEF